jgi:hypothetical protein
MAVILRVIGGIVIIAIGCHLVIKTEWYMSNFGQVAWAEQHLGLDGGSRLFYKLIGIGFAILGIMVALNLFGAFFLATVGQLLLPKDVRDNMPQ